MTSTGMIPVEPAADKRGFRNALGRFATGVTVVATRRPSGEIEGLTVSSFSPLSLDPPLVVWSIRSDAPSASAFSEGQHFAISVLSVEQREESLHFATPQIDKFAGRAVAEGIAGCPLLAYALAWFECKTVSVAEHGDHLLIVGEVIRAAYREGDPLLFYSGSYRESGNRLPDSKPQQAHGRTDPDKNTNGYRVEIQEKAMGSVQ